MNGTLQVSCTKCGWDSPTFHLPNKSGLVLRFQMWRISRHYDAHYIRHHLTGDDA